MSRNSSSSSTMCSHLSIEQVEVIRRLRNSGATLQQISNAYQMFDKLDKELGSFGLVEKSSHLQSDSFVTRVLASQVSSNSNNSNHEECVEKNVNRTDNLEQLVSQQAPHDNRPVLNRSFSEMLKEVVAYGSPSKHLISRRENETISIADRATNSENSTALLTNSILSSALDTQSTVFTNQGHANVPRNIAENNIPTATSLKIGDPLTENKYFPEGNLKEIGIIYLLSLSKSSVCELIERCASSVTNFHPWLLAKCHGIKHKDLLMFLSGDISVGDNNSQTILINWFLDQLCQTDWFFEKVIYYYHNFISKESSQPTTSVDFIPRRERFNFHDIHLAVFQSHFKKNPYPSPLDKKLIAAECNIKMATSSGVELSEKELISLTNVDNWFKNRRKDIIRKSKLDREEAYQTALHGQIVSTLPSTSHSKEQFFNPLMDQELLMRRDNAISSSSSYFPSRSDSNLPPTVTSSVGSLHPGNSYQPNHAGIHTSSGMLLSSVITPDPVNFSSFSGEDTNLNPVSIKQESVINFENCEQSMEPSPPKSQKLNVSSNFHEKSFQS